MKFEFSAGGIVYKQDPSAGSGQEKIYILVAQHSQHHGWVFPKGLIGVTHSASSGQDKKESKHEAALREVQEETGIKGKILQELEEVSYWYQFEGQKIKKTVYYFIMQFVSGDTSKHDFEMEQVEWIPQDKVENRLTYPSDKKVWLQAKELIASRLPVQ